MFSSSMTVEKLLPCGTVARMTCTVGMNYNDVFVVKKSPEDSGFSLVSNKPNGEWKGVDEYVKNGRLDIFKYFTVGEMLKLVSETSNTYGRF